MACTKRPPFKRDVLFERCLKETVDGSSKCFIYCTEIYSYCNYADVDIKYKEHKIKKAVLQIAHGKLCSESNVRGSEGRVNCY